LEGGFLGDSRLTTTESLWTNRARAFGAPIVTDGNVDVEVDVDVDGHAASLTFTARTSPKYLVGPLFASRRTDARDQVHVHDHDHVHVHVQVDAVRAFTARPIALSRFLHTL